MRADAMFMGLTGAILPKAFEAVTLDASVDCELLTPSALADWKLRQMSRMSTFESCSARFAFSLEKKSIKVWTELLSDTLFKYLRAS